MSLNKYFDVLGLGSVTVDLVGTSDSWPAEGTKKRLDDFVVCDGGLIGTALVAVSKLGGGAGFAGVLGYSEMAQRALSQLEIAGVDTSLVTRTDGAEPITSLIITNTTTGQRNIFWSERGVVYPRAGDLPCQSWYEKTGVLLIDHVSAQAGVSTAEIANQHDIPVVADIDSMGPFVEEIMAVSTHVVASEDFAVNYSKSNDPSSMLNTLQTKPNQTVIITQGEKGCIVKTADETFELQAFKVEVLDTTGCGDVFHGAYALAISRGQPVRQAARFASGAAALCATKLGGRDGIPTKTQLANFLQNRT